MSGTPLSTDLSAVPMRKITTARRHTIFHPHHRRGNSIPHQMHVIKKYLVGKLK
jgi:hypothetical protein